MRVSKCHPTLGRGEWPLSVPGDWQLDGAGVRELSGENAVEKEARQGHEHLVNNSSDPTESGKSYSWCAGPVVALKSGNEAIVLNWGSASPNP